MTLSTRLLFPARIVSPASSGAATLRLLVALLGIGAAGCTDAKSSPPREFLVWRPIANYAGDQTVQTSSFTSDTGSLRFRWEAKDRSSDGSGTLRVIVHSAISGRPLDEVVHNRGNGQDTSYLHEDPRVFYLVVEAENVAWRVRVEEGIPATVEGP